MCPLKRVINEEVLDEIASLIVENELQPKDKVTADDGAKGIVISHKHAN